MTHIGSRYTDRRLDSFVYIAGKSGIFDSFGGHHLELEFVLEIISLIEIILS